MRRIAIPPGGGKKHIFPQLEYRCLRLNERENTEADDMTDETLVMAEELTSLRLYADLLRARLSGTVIQQQERLRHMTRRVRF